ncbi:serine protease [Sphingobacterium sp. 2149]|uniref:S1 family peptidase n=1 Tax=Sphingobacterium sp. 2149 TaxID=2817763 RepID=UPI002858568F|nr:serine protease [Sphingobacterium sp. 2149]MDR6734779.1 S1-C subfamily serine protease [Sphingobacterium sp. 2149]
MGNINIGKYLVAVIVAAGLTVGKGKAQVFTNDAKIMAGYERSIDSLLASGESLSGELAQNQLKEERSSVKINAVKPLKRMLKANALYNLAKQATVMTGCAYLCPKCDKVHLSESSGYIIDPKGIVVTNYHVMATYAFMKDGNKPKGFFVRLSSGKTYRVKSILGSSKIDDLAILQLDTQGEELPALPLAERAEVGDKIYVLGHPKGMHYYFSQGYVNNKYLEQTGEPNNRTYREMMAISADYATGSSGGPVLDIYGNVVGTVSNTNMLLHSDMNPSVQMVVKNTVPVESLRKIVSPL